MLTFFAEATAAHPYIAISENVHMPIEENLAWDVFKD